MRRLGLLPIGCLIFTLVFGPNAVAQEQLTDNTLTRGGTSSPPAQIGHVSWIAGTWRGSGLGGQVEEIWSAPQGGAMMGMFRMIQNDQIGFYELMTIAEHEGSLVLRLKHFEADMTGWEEKAEIVEFPLVRVEPGVVYFDGLTIRRAEDGLEVFVVNKRQDGTYRELAFTYQATD